MSVAEAEKAALAELLANPVFFPDEATATRFLEGVRGSPDKYSNAQGAIGELARQLIAREVQPIVPFGQPPQDARAPQVGRSLSQALDVEVTRIKDHHHYRKGSMGREVYPGAPSEHYFSHLRIDHTMSGFTAGSKEEEAGTASSDLQSDDVLVEAVPVHGTAGVGRRRPGRCARSILHDARA